MWRASKKTTAFAGFDSINPPAPPNASGLAAIQWLNELYIHSNLHFTGMYLAGPIPAGTVNADFTGSSRLPGRASWVGYPGPRGPPGVLTDMVLQGWGVVFWYVGLSVTGGESAPAGLTEARARQLGGLHGRHIKKLIFERGADFAGCTVMVDNEDPNGRELGSAMIEYYNTMFQEMRTAGPAPWGAVRPGLYAHPSQVAKLIPQNPDLFVWTVQLGSRNILPNEPEPFEQVDSGRTVRRIPHHNRITGMELAEPTWHMPAVAPDVVPPPPTQNITLPIQSLTIDALQVGRVRTALPLGGQLIWYQDQQHPYRAQRMPTQALNKVRTPRCTHDTLEPASNWDFDFSLVRNPCFPIGSPRFYLFLPSKICGFYSKETLSMRIFQKIENRTEELAPPTSDLFAAEAPLIPLSNTELLTLGQSGLLMTSAVSGTPPVWAPFQALSNPSTAVPGMRRLRAFSAAAREPTDIHLFYISDQNTIISRRRLAGAWSDAVIVLGEPVHPFSNIASSHRGPGSVDIFYINASGALHTAWWTFDHSQTGPWPSTTNQRLPLAANPPALYPGTAIASVSPAPSDLLVFVIGLDLHLYMHSFIVPSWAASLTILGNDTFVLSHSQLSVLATSFTNVRVAAMNDRGDVCVFEVTKSGGGSWVASTRVIVLEHHAALPPRPRRAQDAVAIARAPEAEAISFDVNPFGDIALVMYNGELTVFVAGIRGGETALLRKSVEGAGPWWRERGLPGVG